MSSSPHTTATVPYQVVPWQIYPHGFNNRPARELRNTAMIGFDSYYEAEKYSRNVAYLSLALVGAAIFPGVIRRLRCRYPRQTTRMLSSVPGFAPCVALLRQIAYYQPKPFPGLQFWRFPSLGPLIIVWSTCFGILLYCLLVRPWYRLNREWGSPPLAIRAGMLANGLFPILFALSTKVNLVSILTAISHERLQIYHQWTARLMLILVIIHLAPFLWQPLHEGGLANLQSYWNSDPCYWSGAICFALLIWIVLSGSRFMRKWRYEFFVVNHIFSVLVFLGFYFFHTSNYLNSWRYLWVAIYLWAAAVLIRWCQSSLASRYFVHMKASVEVWTSDDGKEERGPSIARIALNTPIRWNPGQHVFLRFPTLAPLQSHPFTIVTLPNPNKQSESQMVCVVRVFGGITRILRDHIVKRVNDDIESDSRLETLSEKDSLKPTSSLPSIKAGLVPAIIDGPYGGNSSILGSFESIIFIAGGLGLTFVLPSLMSLCRRDCCTSTARLVWSVKSSATLQWFAPFLESIQEELQAHKKMVEIEIHVTQMEIVDEDHKSSPFIMRNGRPDAVAEVNSTFKACEKDGRRSLAIVTCGPPELMRATACATSALQTRVWRRQSCIRDLYLINESFGW